jgi:hypothetical protein
MAQSILVFDFGTNEDAAQQARHKVEAWKQGFRLGDKMLLKFEREESAAANPASADSQAGEAAESDNAAAAAKGGKKKATAKGAAKSGAKANVQAAVESERSEASEPPSGKVRLMLRLSFSDHEKLSYQRWLDRIPTEEPFKSASGQTIRAGDAEFSKAAELFDSLD